MLFENQWLQSRNGMYLIDCSKSVYAKRLAKPMKRVLNKACQGKVGNL